ncbi:MAG TPA: 50S ribosomal protein L10 [Herpetosiphonaceae bacterium]|nr:50S ribosomal protein L10 [Herpetosiphonaceae bacterium]
MPNKQNIAGVEVLRDKLSRSQLTLVSEYRGLSVAELSDLRAALRPNDAEVLVAKNTLTKIAANDIGISELDEFLGGPITLTLAYGDPVAAAKALNNFLRTARNTIKLRGGVIGGQRIEASDLDRVASTPSREQSIARVMGGVNAPATRIATALSGVARNIAYILAQVAEGKGNAANGAQA